MSIKEKFINIIDERNNGTDCLFNGFLEDYLSIYETEDKEILTKILEIDDKIKICVDYRFNINKTVISNQIIRYKDITKIPDKTIKCPYILYLTDETDKGIILTKDEEYIISKGYYYCLTEQEAIFDKSRNELIVLNLNNPELVIDKSKKYLTTNAKAGAIQREVDNYYYQNINEMIEQAQNISEELVKKINEEITSENDRANYIYQKVISFYFLKKVVYVSYMMNKTILEKECDNNIKKQRFNAKSYSDRIKFVPYSFMWRK